MRSSTKLTLLLTLKGRPLHTLRFLWHANALAVPYRILIADGEVRVPIASLLKDPKTFPALDLEYVTYPDDQDYETFFRKIADAATRVTTPYVMQVDNDDFIFPSGLDRAIAFLDANNDYVAASGRIGGFSVESREADIPAVTGRVSDFRSFYSKHYMRPRISGANARERLDNGISNYSVLFYHITRTGVFQALVRDVSSHGIRDLGIHEICTLLYRLVYGNAYANPATLSYLRQYGTSTAAGGNSDLVDRLLSGTFSSNLSSIANTLSSVMREREGGDVEKHRAAIYESVGIHLRRELGLRYGIQESKFTIANARRKFSRLVGNDPYRKAIASVRRAGADDSYVDQLRGELEVMKETLNGSAFRKFVAENVIATNPSSIQHPES